MTDTKILGVGRGFKNPRFQRILNSKIHATGPYKSLGNNQEGVAKLKEIMKKETRFIRYKGISRDKGIADLKKIKDASIAAGEEFTSADKKITKQIFADRSTRAYTKAGTEENKAGVHGQFVYKRNINPAVRNHDEHTRTSINDRTTSAFRDTGGVVNLVKGSGRSENIFTSASAAANKNKPTPGTAPTKTSAPKLQY